jgi:hypothetical protein
VKLDPFAVGQGTQLFAPPGRPVEWIAMRALAVNLNPVVAKSFGGLNQFGKSQGFASIPYAKVGDAIES